tara:strand:- start:176 stop:397 length:222 start_codon:yes stop_codon:yes gene_type:complete
MFIFFDGVVLFMGLWARFMKWMLRKAGLKFCIMCDEKPAQVGDYLCYGCDYEMQMENHAEYIRDMNQAMYGDY